MTPTKEINLKLLPIPSWDRLNKLRPIIRRVLRFPILRLLSPLAKRIEAVAKPAGKLFVRFNPIRRHIKRSHTVTVLSANLWHDWPRYRRLKERIDSFAHLVEEHQADILLLQEVVRTPEYRSDEWLAERLGMAYSYSRANGHAESIGFEEGLAVFSRFPMKKLYLQQWDISLSPFARRLALGAELATPMGDLMAFSVHLSPMKHRNIQQIGHLRNWVNSLTGNRTALVGGDFNAHEDAHQINQAQYLWLDTFRAINPNGGATTHEIRCPINGKAIWRKRLDYIFLHNNAKKWKVVQAKHVDSPHGPHSDHRAVMAKLLPQPA